MSHQQTIMVGGTQLINVCIVGKTLKVLKLSENMKKVYIHQRKKYIFRKENLTRIYKNRKREKKYILKI